MAENIVDYENLKILGDSFLKFSCSFFLFKTYPSLHEGILTNVKGKLVGNKNLLDCGVAKNLPNFINTNDFSPNFDWNPPLFSTPEVLLNYIVSKNMDPSIISRLEIPQKECLTGILSEETIESNRKLIDEEGVKKLGLVKSPFLNTELMSDKTISDVVEALIGVYLLNGGLAGGFKILNWFGILPESNGTYEEIMKKPVRVNDVNDEESAVMTILGDVFYTDLEETLGYTFKRKELLLEAITHPSYVRNRLTPCYQRLEFLGDAILDFLVTVYIQENFKDMNPGLITDIRSALVNNSTLACLSVKYDFHKYLLYTSSPLNKCIENFVKIQISNNHAVNEQALITLEENDAIMAESVTVPKALGDIFESLAGAIFIDSENSLETVWNVFYKIMKKELDEFTVNPPKTAVRVLHEICGEKPFFETTVYEKVVSVKCSIYYKDEEIVAHGFGDNKKDAKKSACKMALKQIFDGN
ncbi:dicer-1, putative [Pediculus humanus corporis]|uniref:Dicer-1, putative n=1 Tax=Pediculus humanus subsp. corporis TaxID=121224 RepID=E0VG65_PEDHC|nr:dicer-1, putative [Pediculus humanus corporis]EEB12371.1 dicer-1, putative [Pediculus humanus corporis]